MSNANQPAFPMFPDTPEGYLPIYGLTKREHACILLRIPDTGDAELDALIAKAQRRDVAAMAMVGLCVYDGRPNRPTTIEWAMRHTDAILAELEKPR